METQPLQRCDNCRKDFPESKMATHFGYCRRNIKKCETCQEMIDINFKQQHEEEYHKKEQCPHCKKIFPSNDLKKHDKVCVSKPKYCQYCDLNVPVTSFDTHLKACESRTKPCTKCNKPIMNKQYLIHIVSCNGPVEAPKNYQEHIMQQQKKNQLSNPAHNYGNSREKVVVNGNGGLINYGNGENKYVNIIPNGKDKNNVIQHKFTYESKPLYQQKPPSDLKPTWQEKPKVQYKSGINEPRFKVEQKKQAADKYPNRPRKDEPNKIMPPPVFQSNNREIRGKDDYKKQQYIMPRPGVSNQGSSGSYDAARKNVNSKEGSRAPVSNKAIYGTSPHQQPGLIKGPPIKETKYAQKSADNNNRRDLQEGKNLIKNSNYGRGPVVIEKPREKNVQMPPTRIPEKPKITPPPMNPSFDQPYAYEDYGQTNDYEISAQEKQMQKIIEQSLKEQKGGRSNHSYKPNKPQSSKDTTDFGEDMFNESFIQKQKAIEEQFYRQKKYKK